ncbi:NUDIX hydrolase [candidate division TM7 genomosp. GTL1]|nr:NUDIX hydrolase [candidate division TM7 genomosp. GTL1]
MEHSSHFVDVLDRTGKTVGKKRRGEIDKAHDIYKSAHILLITPEGEPILSYIKVRDDLPNLYSNHYGATTATIIRTGETPEEAARRAVSRELFIDDADIRFVGESFQTMRDGKKEFVAFFYLIGDSPAIYSQTDINKLVPFSPNSLDQQIAEHRDKFAPNFDFVWHYYRSALPL